MTNQTDPLDEILDDLLAKYPVNPPLPGYKPKTTNEQLKLDAKAAINAELAKAVHKKVMDAIDFVDGDGLIAKRASYQPYDHDPIHSWPIIAQEVLIVPLQQRKDRIKSLMEQPHEI